MSNPFSKVIGFIKHAAVSVSNVFVGLFGHDEAAAFGHASLGILESALGKIAVKVVAGLNSLSPTLSNSDKRSQAFSAIAEEAKAQGIGASNSIINLLIELAVQFVSGSFAKVDHTVTVAAVNEAVDNSGSNAGSSLTGEQAE